MAEFFGLDGRVALVTGAGRGIGAGIARRLHAAGARIAVFDRDEASARAIASELGGLALAATFVRRAGQPVRSTRPRRSLARSRSW